MNSFISPKRRNIKMQTLIASNIKTLNKTEIKLQFR